MSTFFLHIFNGAGEQPDEHGSEFATAEVAVAEATKTAGELLGDEVRAGIANGTCRIVVEDAGHHAVAEVAIRVSTLAANAC